MPNVEQMRVVLQAAARDAKRARAAGMSLAEQTAYILLVAGQQARNQRRYELAMTFHLARSVLVAAGSINAAWSSLTEEPALDSNSGSQTPVSNTGVTNSPADVPLEYFTRGK